MTHQKIIIGAGLYGLYSALFCGKQSEHVLVIEVDETSFGRATYINQARVHNGYHYPRSISTALKSRSYFDRFNEDYGFCIYDSFDQVYATSSEFSWTNAQQFKKFCINANIRCDELLASNYFNDGLCDGAFLTKEYTYDAQILKKYFLDEIEKHKNIEIVYNSEIVKIEEKYENYEITLADGKVYSAPFVINATYASVNQIHEFLNLEPFKIKYELCEIILCTVSDKLKGTGITVMDGPFFSIMPFGKTGYHSLTSVTFTPHITSNDRLPTFVCQEKAGNYCTQSHLGNCNQCTEKPDSAWPYMSKLARKYLKPEYSFEYVKSLYSMKPILKASEIDDSRPTLIRKFSDKPTFISVLSGKINTVYDLDSILLGGK